MNFKILLVLCLLATVAVAGRRRRNKGKKDGTQGDGTQGGGSQGGGSYESGSDSGSSEERDPLHGEDFQRQVSEVKQHFLEAANMSSAMHDMAAEANVEASTGDFTLWDTVRGDFDSKARQVGHSFEEAEEKLWKTAESLYTNPGDFNRSYTCVALHDYVAANSDSGGNFNFTDMTGMGALHAMQADIWCFHELYASAQEIPDDTSAMAMEDAFDLVAEIYKRVFRLKTAGMRLHRAFEAVGRGEEKYNEGLAARGFEVKERVLLKRLLTLLNKNL